MTFQYIKKESPNHFNGRGAWAKKTDVIVCHQSGNYLKDSLVWYLRKGSNCSPNWLIDQDGTIYELVKPDNAAMCNGTRVNAGEKLYYGLATSKIVKSRKTNANYYTYSIEFVHWLKGDITEAQKASFVELVKEVIMPHMKKNGVTPIIDRDHIIGHCEIDPVTRSLCPGKEFPYNEIISRINGTWKGTTKSKFNVGDKVHINPTAKNYANSTVAIPAKYKTPTLTYTISKIDDKRALIKELYSWVLLSDLIKI